MADKSFGVDQLDILGTGTPTISAPNQLNLDAHTVAISTSVTVGEGMSAVNISATGISTIAQPANSNPMANWTITNNSASAYRFTGPGQSGSDDNPDLYLVRGHRYIFKHNATTNHPIQIRVASGGAAYTDGITYSDTSNNRTTDGNNLIINLQHDAPARLFYQCTAHGGMVGNIYTVGGPQVISGVVTATTFSGSGASLTGIVNANISASAAIGGEKINPAFTSNVTITNTAPRLDFVDSDNNSDYRITNSNGTLVFYDTTNAATRLNIKSDGKVGVGTDSPLSILSAYGENRGEGTVTGQITAKDNAAYNASPTAGIVFQGHYASNNAQAIFAGITGFKENANDGNLAGALALHVRANGAVAYEALRIKSDGNVIIGSGGSWSYPKALNVQGSSGSILSLYNADTTTYAANTTSAIEFKLLTGNTGNQSGSCEIRAFKENGTNGNNARALSFYTGGNGGSPSEKLRITSDGEVTKPNNPRFQAYMSGTHFQISGGSNNIAYNTEVYDVGSNYNTSNGRFTAPVDGAYYFQHCLQVRKALSGTGVIEAKVWVIPVGGSATERIRDYKEVIATNMSGRAFGVLQLNAGDQVYPAYYSGINPTYVQNNGGNTPLTSFFEGYLVG